MKNSLLIGAAFFAFASMSAEAQQRRQPPAPAEPAGSALRVLPVQAAAQGAARQWATEAFTATKVRFSFVNPGLTPVSVRLSCFDWQGEEVTIGPYDSSKPLTGAYVRANAGRIVAGSFSASGPVWCRASSDDPYLFAAGFSSNEMFGGNTSLEPITTFVLVK